MAYKDFVFPHTVKKIGTKKEYNGINWASVEEQLTKLTKVAHKEESTKEKLERFLDRHPDYKEKLQDAGEYLQRKISKLISENTELLNEENDDKFVQVLDLAFTDPDTDSEDVVNVDMDEDEDGPTETVDPKFKMASDYDTEDDGYGGNKSEVEDESDESEEDDDEADVKEAKLFLSKLAAKETAKKCSYCGKEMKSADKDGKATCAGCAKVQKCALKNCDKKMMVGKMKKENGKAYCCSKCAKADGGTKNNSGDKKSEFFEKMKKEKTVKASSNAVINFTSLSQISADAVIAAEQSGDERLKQTILDARHQRRQAIAARIEQVQNLEFASQATKSTIEPQEEIKESIKTASINDASVTEPEAEDFGFKPVGDLTYTEQDAFMRLAMKNGFPKEYVISMITPEVEETEHLKTILEVISNKAMSRESQVAAVTAMIKTSELSQKDLNYLKNYWSNQLGYPAKDWVEALFTSKFYKRIGKK